MIDKFLNYQNLDGELLNFEKQVEGNENKKQANLMIKFVKDATEHTKQLNEEAEKIIKEIEKLKEVEAKGVSLVEKLAKQEITGLTEPELKDLELKITNASKNLRELEKRLLTESEKVKNILNDFETTKKKVFVARSKHKENKEKYDEFVSEVDPKIEALKKQLKGLEKDLDAELFSKYKDLRKDGVFPIFVELKEKSCGGCRTNLPSTTLERIKDSGYIRCENCRRIIFTK
jgi:uncharacterized protein